MEGIRYTTIAEIVEAAKKLYVGSDQWKKARFEDLLKVTSQYHDPADYRRFNPGMYFPDMADEEFIDSLFTLSLPPAIHEFSRFGAESDNGPSGPGMTAHVMTNYLYDEPHTHNWFEVICILQGECQMSFEDELMTLHAGDLSIITPQSRRSVMIYNDDCRAIRIALRSNVFDSTFFDILSANDLLSSFFNSVIFGDAQPNYILFKMGNDRHFFKSIKMLFYEIYQVDSFSEKGAISIINVLFCHLLRNCSKIVFYKNTYSEPLSRFPQILLYMQNHYQQVTLLELAQHFHYSVSHLSRYIKASTGRNFSDIMRLIKLEKAKSLLINSNLSINEITEAVGYQSQCHLTRSFKAEYGLSPQQFRFSLNHR